MSTLSRKLWRSCAALALTAAVMLTLATANLAFAASRPPLQRLSSDPYTNTTSQHKTQLEPDTFSYGSTIVSAFQSGRFFDGGASNIGWATSKNNGANWRHGFLPDTTVFATPPGKYARVSDASVAYDAKHKTWIISYLGLLNGANGPVDVLTSSSHNGGITWSNPVAVNATGVFNDKNWSACDNTASSPYYGHCYTEFDNNSLGDLEQMSTSTNGGKSWGATIAPGGGNVYGLGGQPVVQPNGTVIVPFENLNGTISDFTSTNGGTSWSGATTIASLDTYFEPANIRTSPLPSAEIDGKGTVYVAWQDCRFESGCSANDIVYSTSSDGTHWSAVQRIPSDPVGSGIDHFIPGIAVDKATSGSSAHIAVTYYTFSNASCTTNCQLSVGYISSTNAGTSWSASQKLTGPMQLSWLASTNQGNMVGDYISTSINANGTAFPAFAVAHKPKGSTLLESMFTVKGGLPVTGGTNVSHAVVVFQGHASAPRWNTAN